jgi:REP element-mobilizing transposase RayT
MFGDSHIPLKKRWKHSKTTVYNIAYCLIWCPKYRRKVLVGVIKKRLKELLIEKAEQLDSGYCRQEECCGLFWFG